VAGLGEVCSHVGAILFCIDVMYHLKTCTEVPCEYPASVDSIPYAKIADIDFSKPKSTIAPMKRGAHCNNDCEVLSDSSEIEANSNNCSSRGLLEVHNTNH